MCASIAPKTIDRLKDNDIRERQKIFKNWIAKVKWGKISNRTEGEAESSNRGARECEREFKSEFRTLKFIEKFPNRNEKQQQQITDE